MITLICYLESKIYLTLSWWRTLSYRNQSIDLQSKSMDWFLYDDSLRHERVKTLWSNDQAYWQLCHSTLFSHIQGYSEPCAKLIYAETEDTRMSQYSEPFHNSSRHIQNLVIFTKIYKFQNFDTLNMRHIFRILSKIEDGVFWKNN